MFVDKYHKEDCVYSMLKINNARAICPWQVRLKYIWTNLHSTKVSAEHNHKLKAPKTPIEEFGGKALNKTKKLLCKEEADITMMYGSSYHCTFTQVYGA